MVSTIFKKNKFFKIFFLFGLKMAKKLFSKKFILKIS